VTHGPLFAYPWFNVKTSRIDEATLKLLEKNLPVLFVTESCSLQFNIICRLAKKLF